MCPHEPSREQKRPPPGGGGAPSRGASARIWVRVAPFRAATLPLPLLADGDVPIVAAMTTAAAAATPAVAAAAARTEGHRPACPHIGVVGHAALSGPRASGGLVVVRKSNATPFDKTVCSISRRGPGAASAKQIRHTSQARTHPSNHTYFTPQSTAYCGGQTATLTRAPSTATHLLLPLVLMMPRCCGRAGSESASPLPEPLLAGLPARCGAASAAEAEAAAERAADNAAAPPVNNAAAPPVNTAGAAGGLRRARSIELAFRSSGGTSYSVQHNVRAQRPARDQTA